MASAPLSLARRMLFGRKASALADAGAGLDGVVPDHSTFSTREDAASAPTPQAPTSDEKARLAEWEATPGETGSQGRRTVSAPAAQVPPTKPTPSSEVAANSAGGIVLPTRGPPDER